MQMSGSAIMEKDPRLEGIISRLVDAFHPLAIYLFGSKARGDDSADSDYDILLVVPDESPPERRKSRLAYETLRGTAVAADVIIFTKSGFDSRSHIPASLPSAVAREGIRLYGD